MSQKEIFDYFNQDSLAADTWVKKYKQDSDITPDDMHRRMAKEFARIEFNYQLTEPLRNSDLKTHKDRLQKLSKYGQKREFLNENKIYNLFKNFKYVVPQGSIMATLGNNFIGSLSNCFVVGQPVDSYGGILEKDEELVHLMRRRGGVGIDISTLRPKGTGVSGAAKTSTGAVSFMHRYSNTTREVAQDGRRGALMISIDINHPDVMDFIEIKRDLTQVTGANISIKLNDEFMKAVENDEDYILRFPCTAQLSEMYWETDNTADKGFEGFNLNELYQVYQGNSEKVYIKKIKAKEYWNEINKSAHNVAEPGLMFWDNMVNYSPDGAYPQFKQITTNPCSEIGMQPYDACRLIAVNLISFVENPYTDKAYFDFKKFYSINYEAMRLSDDLIDLEAENIDRIINKVENDPEGEFVKFREINLWKKVKETALSSRRTGLGFTALGDTLAALGFKYDSDEALLEIEKIMRIKLESELDCTTDLSILRGTFKGWDKEKEFTYDGSSIFGKNEFYKFIAENFPTQALKMNNYGRRNVSWSTVAPTGTVSMMTQTTSGVEPVFSVYPYIRRKKINPGQENTRVDFVDDLGDKWQEFIVVHPELIKFIKAKGFDFNFNPQTKEEQDLLLNQVCDFINNNETPWSGSSANDINWVRRVEIQGVIQKYITHSISSTINLPNDVTEDEVAEIYIESWKKGLKGITVYRDGSRSGVLITSESNKSRDDFDYVDAVKRPKVLEAERHVTRVGGKPYNVFVGLINKKPYEIFIEEGDKPINKGTITKIKRGEYIYKNETDEKFPILSNMTDEQSAITRLVSTSLRHGADIKYIVEQLSKTDGDLFSFTKGLARVLKKFIPDGAKSTVSCQDCGSENVIFEEGCNKCRDCGSSRCG